MPIYLVLAYVIFCGVPLGLWVSIAWRRRVIGKQLEQHAMPGEALVLDTNVERIRG